MATRTFTNQFNHVTTTVAEEREQVPALETQNTQKNVEMSSISPLDARLPDVSLQEMQQTGKSAARLRVEKGIGSPVDWFEVQIEKLVSKSGRER